MPDRPVPIREGSSSATAIKGTEENDIGDIMVQAQQLADRTDVNDENEGEVEADEILNNLGGVTYKQRIDNAIKNIE